jgi:hypothetical protein
MARQVQLRRGTTAENNEFTGAIAELTMDTDTNTLRIHDGTTVGGIEVPTSAIADYVVATQLPTADNNYEWYRLYKSGWVEQGGRNAGGTITLPVPMKDSNYNAEYSQLYDYTGDWNNNYRIRQTNPTTLVVHPAGGLWYVCGISAPEV